MSDIDSHLVVDPGMHGYPHSLRGVPDTPLDNKNKSWHETLP